MMAGNDILASAIEAKDRRIADLEADTAAIRDFAGWAINHSHFGALDIEGEELRDKAVELGLLNVVPWDGESPVDGYEDDMSPGDPVYVESDLLRGGADE